MYQFEEVALLTSKQVVKTEGPHVWFGDGSIANLKKRTCVNRGQGEIRFIFLSEYDLVAPISEKTFEYKCADRIVIEGGDIYLNVHPSETSGARVTLLGTPTFHDETQVRELQDGIALRTAGKRGGTIMFVNGRRVGDPVDGCVEIHAPRCTTLLIKCRGGGVSQVHIPIGKLHVEIDGSLDLDCIAAARAYIDIRGSGHVRIEEVTDICHVNISGSGNVNLVAGQLTTLNACVTGSGTVFAGASVRQATLEQTGSGSIALAQVIEQSSETQQGTGLITVLKRGP